MNYEQHPLSRSFPPMSESQIEALTCDIKANGQCVAIVTYEGKVLDGWNRNTICVALGVAVKAVPLADGEDPVAYVLSQNLHRRHMSGSQRAASIVACREWRPVGQPVNCAPGAQLQTSEQMAKEAGVSIRTIVQAKAAHARGFGESVSLGQISVKRAAELAKVPREQKLCGEAQVKPAGVPSENLPEKVTTKMTAVKEAVADPTEEHYSSFDPAKAPDAENEPIDKSDAARVGETVDPCEWRCRYLTSELAEANSKRRFFAAQLLRCGEAVNVVDPNRTADAVEALVSAQKVTP